MSRYDNTTKTGHRFSLESFDEDKRLTSRLTAQTIKWDTLYQWRIFDYVKRDFRDDREYIERTAARHKHSVRAARLPHLRERPREDDVAATQRLHRAPESPRRG